MAQFPTLKTGAVAQYPVAVSLGYRADIVSFLDGSEQRFRNSPSTLHEWEIPLAQLDEAELANIQQFFLANQGGTAAFAFKDPASGITYPNCSIAGDAMNFKYAGPLSGQTRLFIRENRV